MMNYSEGRGIIIKKHLFFTFFSWGAAALQVK